MRTLRRYLRSVIGCLTAAAILIRRKMPWGTGQPKRVIVLGDSYASAYGVTAEQSWPAIYADRLGCDLANLAKEGATSDALIDKAYTWPSGRSQSQLAEALSLLDEAPSGSVTAVVVGIGPNDWLWLRDPDTQVHCVTVQTAACDDMFTTRLETLGDNLDTILTDLQSALEPGTHLIVMTYCAIWNPASSDAANSVILSAIDEHGGTILADLREPFAGRDSALLMDTVHPSIAGHIVIADIFSCVTPQAPDSTTV